MRKQPQANSRQGPCCNAVQQHATREACDTPETGAQSVAQQIDALPLCFSCPKNALPQQSGCLTGWQARLHAVEAHKVVQLVVLDDGQEQQEEDDERRELAAVVDADQGACMHSGPLQEAHDESTSDSQPHSLGAAAPEGPASPQACRANRHLATGRWPARAPAALQHGTSFGKQGQDKKTP